MADFLSCMRPLSPLQSELRALALVYVVLSLATVLAGLQIGAFGDLSWAYLVISALTTVGVGFLFARPYCRRAVQGARPAPPGALRESLPRFLLRHALGGIGQGALYAGIGLLGLAWAAVLGENWVGEVPADAISGVAAGVATLYLLGVRSLARWERANGRRLLREPRLRPFLASGQQDGRDVARDLYTEPGDPFSGLSPG